MALSKHASVMKVLVEEILRRHGARGAVDRTEKDVLMALEVLALMTKNEDIFIIADSARFVFDFKKATGMRGFHIQTADAARGIDNAHIIILHTGVRSNRQKEIFDEIGAALAQRDNLQYWHIGVWRV